MTREEAIELAIKACKKTWNEKTCKQIRDVLEQEPKTGHWIESKDIDFYKCSECECHWGKGIVENCNMDYCPNCGARMVESEDIGEQNE